MTVPAIWLGRVRHADAVAAQEARRDRVLGGDDGAQAVLLCEHDPVITLGRNANGANVVAGAVELGAQGVEVVQASRGGDVTYHGPGQLMIYPVVRLRSVVGFLETCAAAIAQTCAAFGAPGAAWRRDPAGLWLGDAKLAACGIHVARGVSVHGFALNVATPADAWRTIRPCGLSVAQISLVEAVAGTASAPPSVEAVARELGPRLACALGSLG